MTQAAAVESWSRDADEVTRRRALRLQEDDPLPTDMATALGMAGVTVIPLDPSEVEAPPLGYVQPDVLIALLASQR